MISTHIRQAAVALLWIALFFVFSGQGWAAEDRVLVLSGEVQKASLAGWMDLLVDPEGILSIDDIPDSTESARFVPQTSFGSGGFTRDVHWYRFTIMRTGEAPRRWILEMGPPYLNDIRVFIPTGRGEISEVALGDHVPFARRPVKSRLHALALNLPEGDPTTIYVRLQSTSVLAFIATLRTPESAIADGGAANFFYGVFFGTLAIAVLVNAVFGVWLRDSAMRTYAFYVATLFVHYLAVNGFAAMVVPSDPPWLIDALTGMSVLGVVASLAFVWDRFVNAKENFPRIHWLFMALAAYCLLGIPLTPTHWYGLWAGPVHYAAQGIIPFGMILVAILLHRNGPDAALIFYLLGFSASLVGAIAYISSIHGLLPLSEFTNNSFQISALFHVLLLSIGLAYRVRSINLERAEAHQRAAVADHRAREQRNFVALLSHEFRQPLASILQTSQMVQLTQPGLQGKTAERIDRIRERASHLSGLVDMFLADDTLDSGAFALNIEETPVLPLLLRIVDAQSADTRVVVAVKPETASVIADVEFLSLALGNLIANALRYSPSDTTIEAAAEATTAGVAFSITNHGPGLTSDELAHAGNIYFRGRSSEGTRGMGLGLHLARKIADAHGGTLKIDSSPEGPTTVILFLPLVLKNTP